MEVRSLEKDAKAGRYEMQITELRTATEEDRAWMEALKLRDESLRLSGEGKFDDALLPAERAVITLEKIFGANHQKVVPALSNLASVYHSKGDYAKVEQLDLRALVIFEEAFGPEHPRVANILINIARTNFIKEDYVKAEQFFRRALAILEKTFGLEHLDVARIFNDLALVHNGRGDYVRAEQFLQRAIAIEEKVFGPGSPDLASSLSNLAAIYSNRGDDAKAELLLQRALTIYEKVYGLENRDVALTLNNLAAIYARRGDDLKAEAFWQRALTTFEKALGPGRQFVALSLTNLAAVYERKGDYSKAERFLQQAISILEKRFGSEYSGIAQCFNYLAGIYEKKGDHTKAESLLQQALAIVENKFGPKHPAVAGVLNNLANLHRDQGRFQQAITLLTRSIEVTEYNLSHNIIAGSEREKLIYLSTFTARVNDALLIHTQFEPNNPQALQLALTALLRTKGRTLDAMTDSIAALRRRSSPQDQALLGQFKDTNTQLARLVFGGSQRITPAEHQKQIKAIEEQKEKLEADISNRSAEFRLQLQPVTLESVRSALPDNVALVEFTVYRPFNAKPAKPDEAFGNQRYVAYVLQRRGEAQWVELGEAKAIDQSVDALRQALKKLDEKTGAPTVSEQEIKRLAQALEEKVMRPVRKLLGETRHVLISPDSNLNLVPFAALVDENGRYLVEQYSLSYVTSGRDLLRLQVARAGKSSSLVIADPIYGKKPATRTAAAQPAESGSEDLLAKINFNPLVTGPEADAIKRLMPDSEVLKRDKATETAVKQARAPRILHIATHGFFLQSLDPGATNSRGFSLFGLPATRSGAGSEVAIGRIENPLLRSGLALAWANQRKSADDDGILTAAEVAGLDLWGTKLVVLSACDTGIGEVKNGEGVYGLRRALVLAGAESQVVSLWKVNDDATKDLMIAYYTALKQGEGRAEALRKVQLKTLRAPKRRHPSP